MARLRRRDRAAARRIPPPARPLFERGDAGRATALDRAGRRAHGGVRDRRLRHAGQRRPVVAATPCSRPRRTSRRATTASCASGRTRCSPADTRTRLPGRRPRELDEDALYARIKALADQLESPETAIFNLHVPPYDSGLDTANAMNPDLTLVYVGGQPHPVPVGSHAVRQIDRGVPAAPRAPRTHPRVARRGADRAHARTEHRVGVQQRPHPRGRGHARGGDGPPPPARRRLGNPAKGGRAVSDVEAVPEVGKSGLFARTATGLVRGVPPRSSLILNFIPGHPTQTMVAVLPLRARGRSRREPVPRPPARRSR